MSILRAAKRPTGPERKAIVIRAANRQTEKKCSVQHRVHSGRNKTGAAMERDEGAAAMDAARL